MKNFDDFKDFVLKYKGAILGAIIAIVLMCTGLFKVLLILAIIVAGIVAGNYVQNNKELVNMQKKYLTLNKIPFQDKDDILLEQMKRSSIYDENDLNGSYKKYESIMEFIKYLILKFAQNYLF